jgi:hypothetical protein
MSINEAKFLTEIKRVTGGKRSHILFLRELSQEDIDDYVKRDLFKKMVLGTHTQYYVTENFNHVTQNL